MSSPKTAGIIFFLLVFSTVAIAATINAPQKMPANANWTFSASLDSSDSFDTTDILIDDRKVATVYSNGQVLKDPLNGKFVLDAFVFDDQPNSATGMVLYISYAGLSSGTYSIRAATNQGGSVKGEAEKAIVNVFAGDEILSEVDSKLAAAATDKQSLMAQINTLERDLSDLKNTVSQKDGQINSLQSSLDATNSNLSEQDTKISDLETKLSSEVSGVSKNLDELAQKFLPVQEKVFPKEEPNALIGFATATGGFAQKNWLGLFLILIAAIITVTMISRGSLKGFNGIRNFGKKTNVYDDFDNSHESSILDNLKIEDDKEDDKDPQKGKWARK